MRRSWRSTLGFAVAAGLLVTAAPPAAAVPDIRSSARCDGAPAPWLDHFRSPDERARLVIERMTLEEKIQELGSLRDAARFRETPAIPRLCVPALRMNNGSAGVSTGGPVQFPATALPAPISLASTWDPAQAHRYGVVGGRETRDQGRNLLEGPDLNIARVPVNGRTFEAFGEDPLLAGKIAVGEIQGIQSQGVIADAKHYAANNQETARTSINELIDERTLREIYLPGFEASVKQGRAGSVMCAMNKVNDVFSCSNPTLQLDILKGEWGFPGFVVSDFDSCHSTVDCANNGMDFELPQSRFFSDAALKAAIAAGTVTVATIDEKVRRIFSTMVRYGIFDRPQTTSPIDAAGHGAISRDLAERGAVLLKNERRTLPLSPAAVRSIAVLGPYAGAAHTGGGGSSRVLPLYSVSPAQGMTNRLGAGVPVRYAQGVLAGTPPLVPKTALNPPGEPTVQGLRGEYFPNPTLTGEPTLTRVDDQVAFDFGVGGPAPGLPVDQFSARWTGTLTAPATGTYVMATNSDDGSRVFIDGTQVVDNWGNHGPRTVTAEVPLTAGPHDLRVEYYENGGGASVSFGWILPGAKEAALQAAVDAARASDVAVVMVGDEEAEGSDRPNLALSEGQDQLVDAVVAANPRTVVVLKSGAPVLMPWLDKVPAVLEAWYPGEEDGNAVARLLFGDVNPSGKLPITFPKRDADTPANTPAQYPGVGGVATYSEGVFVGYRHYDEAGVEPLFPFGHGLSYTSFRLGRLAVSPAVGGHVLATVDVTNTGSRAGSEVVQLYVGHPVDPAVPQPPHQLGAFSRVTLAPGQTKRVVLHLPPRTFAHWDTARHGWVVSDGRYRVFAGTSSRDLPLSAPVRMSGRWLGLD
jgi:beta-glucosidase